MEVSDIAILSAILAERHKQRHNYTKDHEYDGAQWIALISMYLGKLAEAELGGGPKLYEKRLIQIGALVMAALEEESKRK